MNYLLSLASAGLLILLFPDPDISWLAPIALAPLLIAAHRERRAWRRFLNGWAAGIAFWFGVCTWIQFVLEVHGGMGRWGGWGTFLLFCVLKALHMAIFTMLAGYLTPRWYAIPAIAVLWVGLERTHGTFGFAWLALGNAGIDMPTPLRLAPWIGVYGLSFVFAMTGAAVALAILGRPRRDLAWLLILLVLPLLPAIPGPTPGTDAAIVVQPNMPEEAEWTTRAVHDEEQRLATASLAAAMEPSKPARLIVWPEVPGPIYFYSDPDFNRIATDLARTAQAYFLFGGVAHTADGRPLNSAVMLAPDGHAIDRYDKMFLVPFGEFVPPLFSWVNRITKEAGDFAPGNRTVVFPFGDHRLGAFICYESAFPHLVRQFVNGGADILANLSNDGYFGRSAAREQHLKLVRMRAVENRRWILRSTNDGMTATVDPGGRVTARVPPYSVQLARMQFGYVPDPTFYSRHGDWFAWTSLALGLALSLAPIARSRMMNNRRSKMAEQ